MIETSELIIDNLKTKKKIDKLVNRHNIIQNVQTENVLIKPAR